MRGPPRATSWSGIEAGGSLGGVPGRGGGGSGWLGEVRRDPHLRRSVVVLGVVACLACGLLVAAGVSLSRVSAVSRVPADFEAAAFEHVLEAQREAAHPRHEHAARVRASNALNDPGFAAWKEKRAKKKETASGLAPPNEELLKHVHSGKTYAHGAPVAVRAIRAGPVAGGPDGPDTIDLMDLPWFHCDVGGGGDGVPEDSEKRVLYNMEFKRRRGSVPVQSCQLSGEQTTRLHRMIKEHWFFEVEIDGLPVHGFLGTVSPSGNVLMFRHLIWSIDFNPKSNQIVYVHGLTFDHGGMISLTPGSPASANFIYSTEWEAVDQTAEDRPRRVQKNSFFNQLETRLPSDKR